MAISPSVRAGPLTVQLDAEGASLTVRAAGELDLATTGALEARATFLAPVAPPLPQPEPK